MNIGGIETYKFTIKIKKAGGDILPAFFISIAYRISVTTVVEFYNKTIKITNWLVIKSLETP